MDSNHQLIERRVNGEGDYPTIISKRRTGRLSSSAYVCDSVIAFTTTERTLLGQDTLRSHLQTYQYLAYRLQSALTCCVLACHQLGDFSLSGKRLDYYRLGL
uniref:Uncharacterized protein n=1 Tax=Pectobacterium phage Amona TaxID=3158137 RepID=A0AB39ABA8_9CAUD